MSNTDHLERKIRALERIFDAQRSGLLQHSTIMTLDSRGKTEEGASQVLQEELERRGLTLQDFEDAGLDFIHLNLWWAEGRDVSPSEQAWKYLNHGNQFPSGPTEPQDSATD